MSYSFEEAMLRDHLREGTNVWDYTHRFKEFLEWCQEVGGTSMQGWLDGALSKAGVEEVSSLGEESYELFDDWEASKTEAQEKEFVEWLESNSESRYNPYDAPAYETMSFREYLKPGWLVHFTDDAYSVAMAGFQYGHPDLQGIHLTTYKRERKKQGGYNFAFQASDRRGILGARNGKYGNEFVVFWSSGVLASHFGDDEDQVVFWGPSVSTDMVIPVVERDGYWTVEDRNGRVARQDEDIFKMINWVVANWRMARSITSR